MKERLTISSSFVVATSALNSSFSFLAFLLFQLTVSVVLSYLFSMNFFKRLFPFYFLFSVKFVVGLACAIPDEYLLSKLSVGYHLSQVFEVVCKGKATIIAQSV